MLRKAYTLSRPQKLFVICAAIFITALVVAEATASKFFIAVTITPVIYLAHWVMDAYLGHETAEALIERVEEGDGFAKETLKPSTRGAA